MPRYHRRRRAVAAAAMAAHASVTCSGWKPGTVSAAAAACSGGTATASPSVAEARADSICAARCRDRLRSASSWYTTPTSFHPAPDLPETLTSRRTSSGVMEGTVVRNSFHTDSRISGSSSDTKPSDSRAASAEAAAARLPAEPPDAAAAAAAAAAEGRRSMLRDGSAPPTKPMWRRYSMEAMAASASPSATDGGTDRYSGSLVRNQGCRRICSMVMRRSGSTSSMRGMRSRASSVRKAGSVYRPDLIFLNRFTMDSSSNGREPTSSAYRMTPHDHTSTSGPAYRLPLITSGAA